MVSWEANKSRVKGFDSLTAKRFEKICVLWFMGIPHI